MSSGKNLCQVGDIDNLVPELRAERCNYDLLAGEIAA